MKTIWRTSVRLAISTATAYFASFMVGLFAAGGSETPTKDLFQVFLSAEGNPLFLRILYVLAWFIGFIYLMYRLSLDPREKTLYTNEMRGKPYSYAEERRAFWKSKEWIPLLFVNLLWALIVPAFSYIPFIFPAKVLFAFGVCRFFIAFDRYAWCCERIGGLNATEE